MARGHFRNLKETNCCECGQRIYIKYAKNLKEKQYCLGCGSKLIANEIKEK